MVCRSISEGTGLGLLRELCDEKMSSVAYSAKSHHQDVTRTSSITSNFSTHHSSNNSNTNEERPPVDFQISSGSSSSGNFTFDGGYGDSTFAIGEKCPLCLRLKKKFTCTECLLKGDFCHSDSRSTKLNKR